MSHFSFKSSHSIVVDTALHLRQSKTAHIPKSEL